MDFIVSRFCPLSYLANPPHLGAAERVISILSTQVADKKKTSNGMEPGNDPAVTLPQTSHQADKESSISLPGHRGVCSPVPPSHSHVIIPHWRLWGRETLSNASLRPGCSCLLVPQPHSRTITTLCGVNLALKPKPHYYQHASLSLIHLTITTRLFQILLCFRKMKSLLRFMVVT